MNFRGFGAGAGIGVASTIPILFLTTLFARLGPDSNLVNFGPAIFGIGLVLVEMSLALISLILACIWLFRQRWRHAGFGFAFSIIVLAWYSVLFLLAG